MFGSVFASSRMLAAARQSVGATAFLLAAIFSTVARAEPQVAPQETTEQTICRLIEAAAEAEQLPVAYFTRLIWRESSFRPSVTSPAGAQGVAQFMPGTATERGLADPFDPEMAIPASAAYLASMRTRFGNVGLAAAAYNAGPTRLSGWIANGGYLPLETEDYVYFVTGRTVQDWSADRQASIVRPDPNPQPCVEIVALMRQSAPSLIEGPYAPFGVQLAGNYSKGRAIASYERQVTLYPALLAGKDTLILGSRVAGRGNRAFYRVRLPAKTMREATAMCADLQKAGGSCVVLRN